MDTFRRDAQGRWRVNPDKLRVLPFSSTLDTPNAAPAVAANSSAGPFPLSAPYHGPFEIFEIAVQATSLDFTLEFFYRRRNLQNYPIHARSVLGGEIPQATNIGYGSSLLVETLWLEPQETLGVKFTDLSGSSNTIRFVAHGRLYLRDEIDAISPGLKEYISGKQRGNNVTQPFWYAAADPTTGAVPWAIASQATENQTLHIGEDGSFELRKITGISTGDYTIQFTHPSGRQLSNQPIHNEVTVGRAPFPFFFREPLFLKRGTNLQIQITDLSVATNNVYLTLAGRRIYAGDEGV